MKRLELSLVPEWILERWILVAYLIINWNIKDLAERIKVKPNRAFYEVVSKHVAAYVKEGVMPPEDIAPAILNLADDFMANKPMNLRAGDYIAIQNHLRRQK
jgi:hypothetical protein